MHGGLQAPGVVVRGVGARVAVGRRAVRAPRAAAPRRALRVPPGLPGAQSVVFLIA